MTDYNHDQSDVDYGMDDSRIIDCPICGEGEMKSAMGSHLYRSHWQEICDTFDK